MAALDLARKYARGARARAARRRERRRGGPRPLGGGAHRPRVEPVDAAKTLDWVAKLELIDAYRARHDLRPDDHRVQALDLQYHDLRPRTSLFRRLDMETLAEAGAVEAAVTEPADDDAGILPRRVPEALRGQIAAANWDSVVFDLGTTRCDASR